MRRLHVGTASFNMRHEPTWYVGAVMWIPPGKNDTSTGWTCSNVSRINGRNLPTAIWFDGASASLLLFFKRTQELQLPHLAVFGDFGVVFESELIQDAVEASAQFNGLVYVRLKSEAGVKIEFLRNTISFEESRPEKTAELPVSLGEVRKLARLTVRMGEGSAPGATVQKPAGKLCFAQRPVMGRFGRAALKPLFQFIAAGGGELPRRAPESLQCWEMTPPRSVLREIRSAELDKAARICPDANMANITSFGKLQREFPVLPPTTTTRQTYR